VLSIGVTFYFILVGWIFFRAGNFGDLTYLLHKFILFDGFYQRYGLYLREVLAVAILMIGFACFHFLSYRLEGLAAYFSRAGDWAWCGFVTGGILLIMLLAPSRSPEFIYFQF
jgi:hypothetical protein